VWIRWQGPYAIRVDLKQECAMRSRFWLLFAGYGIPQWRKTNHVAVAEFLLMAGALDLSYTARTNTLLRSVAQVFRLRLREWFPTQLVRRATLAGSCTALTRRRSSLEIPRRQSYDSSPYPQSAILSIRSLAPLSKRKRDDIPRS